MAGDEIAWFRKPTPTNQAPYDGGTLNLSYQLLDKAIVEGAADESVLVDVRGSWSHALLLEHVAAFGGALKGLGVLPGDRVLVDLADDRDTVVVLLGASRVGAVTVRPPTRLGEAELAMVVASAEPSVVVTSRPGLELADADPVVISGDPSPVGSAVGWDVVAARRTHRPRRRRERRRRSGLRAGVAGGPRHVGPGADDRRAGAGPAGGDPLGAGCCCRAGGCADAVRVAR